MYKPYRFIFLNWFLFWYNFDRIPLQLLKIVDHYRITTVTSLFNIICDNCTIPHDSDLSLHLYPYRRNAASRVLWWLSYVTRAKHLSRNNSCQLIKEIRRTYEWDAVQVSQQHRYSLLLFTSQVRTQWVGCLVVYPLFIKNIQKGAR